MSAEETAPVPGPDAELQRRELARLTRALDALQLSLRAAFILCEVEERSSAEAGQSLGEKAGTVRNRVFSGEGEMFVSGWPSWSRNPPSTP